jgi:subtilisin-like proprotein convertase family protein
MRQLLTLFLVFGLFSSAFAQSNFWKPLKPESISLPTQAERKIQPLQFNTFQLDYPALKAALSQAPMEFTAAAKQEPVLLNIPLADGSTQVFAVWESPVMASELAAKFPDIRTYAGKAADGSGLTVRLGVSYKGFHAFVFDLNGKVQSVRPYAEGTDEFYMAYRKEDLPAQPGSDIHARCGMDEEIGLPTTDLSEPGTAIERGTAPVTLRKYRLAVSAQGEYSQFHGGTKPLVMSAIVQAVNFLVAVQERDWAVRLELIPNNDTLIYLDPGTDPFTGPLIPNWIGDNPAAINPLIGSSNYDIGHLFARVVNTPGGVYVAGQASIASVCEFPNKAVAGTSLPQPDGENFYVIIAHEMGHQFSATHTFNSCPPSADARTGSTAYEPGGGSTIMSYAGTCSPDLVESNQDSYYHVASIEQAMNFITQGGGATCAQTVVTDNNFPEVNIPLVDSFFIPISTPFTLKCDATDADGDNLSYCWEQFDLGVEVGLGQSNSSSPLFRSFPPNDESSRTFPRLFSIVFNQPSNAEVLPIVNRELKFRVTVRDNHAGGGGVAWDQVRFRASAQAGPFTLTYPNDNTIVWNAGEYQTITWNVANTDKLPVNCQTVNILLSTSNGLTYQHVLASGVPNNGRACVKLPTGVTSNNARIRVEAADNIFFDLSDAAFKLQNPTAPNFSLCAESLVSLACAPTSYTTEISTAAIGGFSDPVTLAASGLPAGVTATFSPNPVAPGSTSTMTVDFTGAAPEGPFDFTVGGSSGALSSTSVIKFTVVQNDFSSMALQTPVDGAQSVDIGPWLYWNGSSFADKYEVQVASSPSFEPSTILATNANVSLDSFKVSPLGEGKICYWRVRPINECGPGPWTEPFVFVTRVQNCTTLAANDLPKNISANGTPTVESKITLANGILLEDVNVKKIQGNHTFMQDLEVRLISPAGTDVLLFENKCPGFNGNFNMGFDDSANGPFSCPPPNNGTIVKPTELLSAMAGQNSTGVWTLRVRDNVISSGGSLTAFELELCSGVSLSGPFIVNNNLLQVPGGTNAIIGENLLKVDDANNSASQLTFTLMTVPDYGDLRITGSPMKPGEQFTQADINAGLLRYYDYGLNNPADDFRFSVSDGEGGLVSGTFNIQPFPLSTGEPLGNINFGLAPNPASESVRLFVGQPLDTDSRVTLLNLAGQQLRTWNFASGAAALQLELGDLPKGVYAVSVENEKGKGVKKVVIQ